MSPSMTRCSCCCRNTLSDDSMAEQVRSQPIVTNRSEISHSTSNRAETLTLLFTKLHLTPYLTFQCAQIITVRKKRKERREGKKTSYTVAVKISSCLIFSFTSASLYVNTNTHQHKETHLNTQPQKVHPCTHTHTAILPVKNAGKAVRRSQREATIFIYLSSE